jgi:hypothetical protein
MAAAQKFGTGTNFTEEEDRSIFMLGFAASHAFASESAAFENDDWACALAKGHKAAANRWGKLKKAWQKLEQKNK